MSNFNSQYNRAVWFDIPVAELDRAAAFYAAVLDVRVDKDKFDGFSFCVIEHKDGNGGCLIKSPDEVSAVGVMIYLNVNGRIRDAVAKVRSHGGGVVEDVHSIAPHGFRAIVLDSEGNRVALHSESDQ
jgi:predicted enzyme related to lactoylglutathione lyase